MYNVYVVYVVYDVYTALLYLNSQYINSTHTNYCNIRASAHAQTHPPISGRMYMIYNIYIYIYIYIFNVYHI